MLQQDFTTARQLTLDERYLDAIQLYEKILLSEPAHVPSHYNLGLIAAKMGELEKARTHFETVIRLEPNFPQGHFQLAQIELLEYKPLEAITQLQIAVDLQADYTDARHLLACTLMQQGKDREAAEQFETLLQRTPEHANGHLNFALLKFHLKEVEAAKQLLESAIALDPTLVEAHYHRGVIAMQQGNIERAILEMQETLDRQTDHFAANYNLAILYKMQHHYKLAVFYLKKAQALEPANESIRFLLAAFEQQKTPLIAPKTFVQELFNHYADTYDQHMEQVLHYKTPAQLHELLNPYRHLLPQNPKILDLGCGTGLVGQYFQDLNAAFIGVDLADEMLTQAKQKNIYQELMNADILEYLKTTQEKFDLIIASDVLNYFGDLNPIFTACKRVLNPKGLLLFSIELTDQQDYFLHAHARFSHQSDYIKTIMQESFELLAEKTNTLRFQENNPVNGKVFLYQSLTSISH
ncbi:MAG: tetratricopeptide repeat protein [Legionellales bacterium]|jgi:predicted TPR repeat methyltransferase